MSAAGGGDATQSDLLQTLSPEQAATLVRRPSSTVTPPHDAQLGKKAFAVLKTLTHDARALLDEGTLGQGGMGVIRLAKQVALDRHVAVKALKPTLGSAADVEALLAEAWVAGGLEHPNILPVYALSLDAEGKPLVVMKRIEGVTWATLISDPAALQRLAPGRAPLEEHLRILQQVCHAVHFAHSRHVLHRDLKPENVMVGAFGEVYVVDWGIACAPGRVTQLAGTPAYMAPEMVGGAGAQLTVRTDVYLLGGMLFEVLTGRAPHQAQSSSELFAAVLKSQPVLPPDVPEELAGLVRRCMSADPAARPASALEVRQALEAFLHHQGSNTLATQSEKRADELKVLTAQPGSDRTRIDALFSECRFGLQMALASWPENARARRVLNDVLERMVRFELAHGSPRTAQVLLSELPQPPPLLKADVDAALSRESQKDAQLQRLKDLEETLDPRTGGISRTLVASVLGAVWVLLPVAGYTFFDLAPAQELLQTAPLALLCALFLTVVAVRSRTDRSWTPLNSQLVRMVVLAMSVQVIAVVTVTLLGFEVTPRTIAVLPFYWSFVGAMMGVSIFRPAWPATLAFFLAGIATWTWPQHRAVFTTLPSVVLVVHGVYLARTYRPR